MPSGQPSPQPSAHAPLVLLDGDLPGLVALASACESIALDIESGHTSDRRGQADAQRVTAMLDYSAPDPDNARLRAARSQAERFGARWISESGGAAPPAAESGHARTLALLQAFGEAARRHSTSVVWPIWQGRLAGEGTPSLDAVATEMDRAELVTRLAGLDLTNAAASDAGGLFIETPYADLDHASIADLSVDLDVPVGLAWWASSSIAQAVRSTWDEALRSAGYRGTLAQ